MMKHIYKYIMAAAFATILCSSCMEEVKPQGGGALASQVLSSDKIGLVNGLTQYLNTAYAGISSSVYTAIGYPEHITWHSLMTADMPVHSAAYNYWTAYTECLYMGDWAWQSYYYWYYYKILFMASNIIKNCKQDNPDDAFYLANGYAFRAYFYLEMTRMYEYRPTGTALDGQYYEKLKGLTMPITNEFTTEEQTLNRPRAPFYEMYRFILGDLQKAAAAMESCSSPRNSKNYASLGMIYGNLARFWMELASRFERHPEDLAEQIANDKTQWPELGEGYQDLPAIGVSSASEAFANAAYYARKVISLGYTPLNESTWHDPKTGFNTANNAWIWAILMSSSDPFVTEGEWLSWVSFMSPEAQWGISGPYNAQFLIDRELFESIPLTDWRRRSWIDPAHLPEISDWTTVTEEQEAPIKEAYQNIYYPISNLDYDTWKQCACPYAGFKFRPGSGNTTTSTTGNRADIPLMRVEEMYYIEAEALAHTNGIAAGKTALESFVKTYRDPQYKCNSSTMREFETEVTRQKRIEFWGEGVSLFDIKRLELPIERGYEGSNHIQAHQFNSKDGYVAPWTILFIPSSERDQNTALVLNPDPTSVMESLRY